MNIAEAISSSKALAVRFDGGGVLNVEYRPPAYTIAQMAEAAADKGNPDRLITMIQDLVSGWDLTRTEKVILEPNGEPVEREVPVDINNDNDVRQYVPTTIIMAIVKAVRQDNDPSGE